MYNYFMNPASLIMVHRKPKYLYGDLKVMESRFAKHYELRRFTILDWGPDVRKVSEGF